MTRLFTSAAIAGLLLLGAVETTHAATVSLQEGVNGYTHQDALIREDNDLFNVNNGSGSSFLAGTSMGSGGSPVAGELRGLIDFDLSSIAGDLAGQAITDVTLVLSAQKVEGTPIVNIHSYGFAFDESVSTWNDPDGDGAAGTGDTTAGGTLGPVIGTVGELSPTGSSADHLFSGASMIAAVEDALTGDSVLRVVVAEGNPSLSSRDLAFYRSSDHSSASLRPELIITYEPVPEPSTIALLLGACLLGVSGVRRR